jgi:hypothetical protein
MLYAIPISSPTESAFAERAAALYGVDVEDPQQSLEAAELQAHWQKALPDIFSGAHTISGIVKPDICPNASPDPHEPPGSEESLRILKWKKVSPFDQFQLIHRWLLPEIYDYVDRYVESLSMSPGRLFTLVAEGPQMKSPFRRNHTVSLSAYWHNLAAIQQSLRWVNSILIFEYFLIPHTY